MTFPNVTGSPKKIMPLAATGSLLRAPTIEYVVEEVVLTHQAVVYEMKTAAAPEKAIAAKRKLRPSFGKFRVNEFCDQSSKAKENTIKIGMESKLL